MSTSPTYRTRRLWQRSLPAFAVVVALLALMAGTALADEPVVPGDQAGVIDPGAVLPDPAPVATPEPAAPPVAEPAPVPTPEPAPPVVEPAPVATPEPAAPPVAEPAPVPTPEPVPPVVEPAPVPTPAPPVVDAEPVDPTTAPVPVPEAITPPVRDLPPVVQAPPSIPVDAAGNGIGTVIPGEAPAAIELPPPVAPIELPPPAASTAPQAGYIELPGPAVAAATQANATVVELPPPPAAPAPPPRADFAVEVIADPAPVVEPAPLVIEAPANPFIPSEAAALIAETAAPVFTAAAIAGSTGEQVARAAAPVTSPIAAFLPDVLPMKDATPTGLLERLASFVIPVDGSTNAILVALFEIGLFMALALSLGRPRPQSSLLSAMTERPLFGYRAVVFRPG